MARFFILQEYEKGCFQVNYIKNDQNCVIFIASLSSNFDKL